MILAVMSPLAENPVIIVWYSEAKKVGTRARRVEKMKQMLSAGRPFLSMIQYTAERRQTETAPVFTERLVRCQSIRQRPRVIGIQNSFFSGVPLA